MYFVLQAIYIPQDFLKLSWPGGATVARLTPVQKVACSNHVRVTSEVLQRRLETKCGAIRNGVVMLCFVIY